MSVLRRLLCWDHRSWEFVDEAEEKKRACQSRQCAKSMLNQQDRL